jgi:hypothetical protein
VAQMTKTIINNAPASLQAFQILRIGAVDPATSQRQLFLSNGSHVQISSKQATQFLPSVGDYYVVPSEGHPYCVAQSTFLQNYVVGS